MAVGPSESRRRRTRPSGAAATAPAGARGTALAAAASGGRGHPPYDVTRNASRPLRLDAPQEQVGEIDRDEDRPAEVDGLLEGPRHHGARADGRDAVADVRPGPADAQRGNVRTGGRVVAREEHVGFTGGPERPAAEG